MTVLFPSAGYYSVEIDYTECHDQRIVLLLGTTYRDPIPPGPSATPTPTFTPSNTPTDTPTNTPTMTPTHAVICAPTPYWCTAISPNINPGSNELRGVAAVTNDDIWAVGSHNYNFTTDSLVQHWDGSAWRIATVTPVGALRGVAKVQKVVPTPELWAVGDNGVLHYANGAWTSDTSVTGMNSVVALGPTDVWVVGRQIRHWTGTWSTPIDSGGQLNGVTANSANDVWAVGYTDQAPNRRPLVKHWDGNQWQTITSAPLSTDSFLNSVDVFPGYGSGTNRVENVWVVGSYADSNSPAHYHTLIERWDGHSWTVVPSPDGDATADYNELRSVWYNSEGDLWAAGIYGNVGCCRPAFQTLIMRWTDKQWQKVDSPNLGNDSELLGIETTSGVPQLYPNPPVGRGNPAFTNSAWAVGRYLDAGSDSFGTLVERIIAPTPTAYVTPQSQSYYEHDADPNVHHQQGCLAASNHDSGLIILDYGEPVPAYSGPALVYGTLPKSPDGKTFATVTVPQITTAVENFADGYYNSFYHPDPVNCPQAIGTPRSLIVALGINNYTTPIAHAPGISVELTDGHAQAWAHAVATVNRYVKDFATPIPMKISSAVDFEPDWSHYDNTPIPGEVPNNPRTWAKAYGNASPYYYYNFGSTDGYPALAPGEPTPIVPFLSGQSAWRVDQFYELGWVFPGANGLPQIYQPSMARDWYRVKRWYVDTYRPFALYPIVGEITQCGDGGCASPFFNWTQAWQVLWLELNSDQDIRIRQGLQLSTDVKN